jgi:carboxylate-amine ligase
VRLSDRDPTIEVRVADVALDVDTAVTVAVLVRALVNTAIRDAAHGRLAPRPPAELLRAASWQAARHGLSGDLVDLQHGRGTILRPAAAVLDSLLDTVDAALRDTGDGG